VEGGGKDPKKETLYHYLKKTKTTNQFGEDVGVCCSITGTAEVPVLHIIKYHLIGVR